MDTENKNEEIAFILPTKCEDLYDVPGYYTALKESEERLKIRTREIHSEEAEAQIWARDHKMG